MKKLVKFAVSASLASALAFASPAVAQDAEGGSNDEAMMAELMAMFAADPLTEEQQGRLPLAGEVIDKMIPPGTLGEVMGEMFDGFLGPIMQKATQPSTGDFAKQLGLETWELDMEEDAVAEATAIIDPVYFERSERQAEVMPQIMTNMMNAMEPTMRKVMTEVFAVHFDTTELTDINAFFGTPSGAAFAKKSMTMSSDPRVIGGMMEAMPEMMGSLENMEAQMEAATADLPAPRGFAELSADEQARLAELTGFSVEELSERAAAAAEAESTAEEATE